MEASAKRKSIVVSVLQISNLRIQFGLKFQKMLLTSSNKHLIETKEQDLKLNSSFNILGLKMRKAISNLILTNSLKLLRISRALRILLLSKVESSLLWPT